MSWKARRLRHEFYRMVNAMDIAYLILVALAMVVAWVVLDILVFLIVWAICAIFGRNYAPAQVPNKAVWG